MRNEEKDEEDKEEDEEERKRRIRKKMRRIRKKRRKRGRGLVAQGLSCPPPPLSLLPLFCVWKEPEPIGFSSSL